MIDWISGPTAYCYLAFYIGNSRIWQESYIGLADGGRYYSLESSIAVWVEPSGRVFAYAQTAPHSSEVSDYWVFDITDQADLGSWGVKLSHSVVVDSAENIDSIMREVEIFYGAKEGISQPRFGGMWWLANPLVFWLMQITLGIQAALAPIALAIAAALAGPLTAIVTAIQTMYSWLQDISQIWGVIISLIVDVWDRFVNVIFPVLFGLLFSTFFAQLNAILAGLHSTILTILTVLSFAMFADATILPIMYTNMITAFQTIFYQLGLLIVDFATLFVVLLRLAMGEPVVGYSFGTGVFTFIFTIFYYVATYLPVGIFIHILLTLMRAVGEQSIEPLIGLALFYVTIIKIFYDVVVSVINVIIGIIQAIGGFIPFT